MKRIILMALALILVCLSGCSAPSTTNDGEETQMNTYIEISQEEAKKMMDAQPEAIILDVREPDEFEESHIPGAKLLPLGSVAADTAAEIIPELDSTVLVYCRSGRRSKMAAQKLADAGYTNIYEFGGIITWPYEIE